MYIKLIQPKMERRPMDTDLKARMAPPLGLLTIANLTETMHRVSIEDENIGHIVYNDQPDLVGITVTVDSLPRAIAIAGQFRRRGIPVVAGGIHITTAADTVPAGCFDALAIGMAEGTWPDIVGDAAAGCLKPMYRCSHSLTGRDIVSPAYHAIKSSQYLYCNVVHTSRGCPFQCDFCYNSSQEHQYKNRPIGDVLQDIRAVGSRHVMFVDDNLIGNPQWTWELMKAIKPLRLKWNGAVSANILDMPKLLDAMVESGCQSLFIGFESINTASLQGVHKVQNATARYDALVHALHSRGIMINASFVFGLDGDTPEVFQNTLDWIVRHKIETVTSHILTPYPGTVLYEAMGAAGRLVTEDLAQYNTAHVVFEPVNMSQKQLYDGYLWMYRELYRTKNILRRLPRNKRQLLPYLAFNFFYRKYGKLTDRLCKWVSYERIGRLGQVVARYLH